jgi:hypothetical protein
MWCSQVRSRISAYTDGELSPVERQTVEEHLNRCAECERFRGQMQSVVRLTSLIPVEDTPFGLHARIMSRLAYADAAAVRTFAVSRPQWTPRSWLYLAATGAAACALVGLLYRSPQPLEQTAALMPRVSESPAIAPSPKPERSTGTPSIVRRTEEPAPVVNRPEVVASAEPVITSPAKIEPAAETSLLEKPAPKIAPERSLLPRSPARAPKVETSAPVVAKLSVEPRVSEPPVPPSGTDLKSGPSDATVMAASTGTPEPVVPVTDKDAAVVTMMAGMMATPSESEITTMDDEELKNLRQFLQDRLRTIPQPPLEPGSARRMRKS